MARLDKASPDTLSLDLANPRIPDAKFTDEEAAIAYLYAQADLGSDFKVKALRLKYPTAGITSSDISLRIISRRTSLDTPWGSLSGNFCTCLIVRGSSHRKW